MTVHQNFEKNDLTQKMTSYLSKFYFQIASIFSLQKMIIKLKV
jgi:hypothetical protein